MYNEETDELTVCLPEQDKFELYKTETWFQNCETWKGLNWNKNIPEGFRLLEVRTSRYFAQAIFDSQDLDK